MTPEGWALRVLGWVGPAPILNPARGPVRAAVAIRDLGRRAAWEEAVRRVLQVDISDPGLPDLHLLVVEPRQGWALDHLRVGGQGLVVGAQDAVLGLGRRSRAELGTWRQIHPPIAVLVGAGGRACLWSTRGLRPVGGDPRLVVLRDPPSRRPARGDTISGSRRHPDQDGSSPGQG